MTAKKKTFSTVKTVKSIAREKVGTPRATRAIPDDKTREQKRATKHKKTMGELLAEE